MCLVATRFGLLEACSSGIGRWRRATEEGEEGEEGKIKADGTIPGHRAQIPWSAHWLGDGARHRPEGGTVPRLAETPAFARLFVAPRLVLLDFCVD